MKRSAQSKAGFTLLEIMLVVMIIALLAGFAISQLGGNLAVAQETRVRGDLNSLKVQLLTYQGRNGHLPTTEQGLKALVAKPTTEPRPRNWTKLADAVPRDPWQMEYHYVRPGTRSNAGYELFSAGPDNLPNTADDIGNWENTES